MKLVVEQKNWETHLTVVLKIRYCNEWRLLEKKFKIKKWQGAVGSRKQLLLKTGFLKRDVTNCKSTTKR